MIVRTAVMDEIVMRLVKEQGVDTVLNLAAGLDARAYRLDLPSRLHWIDVDLEGILSYKEAALAGETPRCRVEFVRTDLTNHPARRALFQRVGAEAGRALVISEGLLVYLTPEDVTSLAQDLSAQPALRWWLIDLGSPALLQFLSRTWGNQLRSGNAPMRFAPEEGTAFFAPSGWRETEYRAILDEAARLKRAPGMAARTAHPTRNTHCPCAACSASRSSPRWGRRSGPPDRWPAGHGAEPTDCPTRGRSFPRPAAPSSSSPGCPGRRRRGV